MNLFKSDLVLLALIVATFYIIPIMSYRYFSLENPDLCSPDLKKKTILLGKQTKSALYINQSRLSDHPVDWEKNSVCKFKVRVDNYRANEGLFAVIQSIVFRKHERFDSHDDNCIDYVQFQTRDGRASKRFCGRSNAALTMDSLFKDENKNSDITDNSFVDPSGELDVYIFVSKQALHDDEETDLSIAFTTFKRCRKASASDKPCDPEHHNEFCIHQGFFNDGTINCPYYNCEDEGGCSQKTVKKPSIGNKVLIGSVTSLLLMFAIFVCCIYSCRKYGKLCWAEEFANPTNTSVTPSSSTRVIEMANSSATSATLVEPPLQTLLQSTAAVNIATAPPAEDKDLPPSYDSLFPARGLVP